MHRHRRRHRAQRPRTALRRSGLAAGAVAVVVASVGLVVGEVTSTSGAGGAASPREARALSSTPSVELSAAVPSPPDVTDRGTVRGVLRLSTDVAADPDTWVAYLVKGPASLVKVSSAAPYGADIDTRELPDGTYTVNEVVFHSARVPKVVLSRVLVDNVGDPAPDAPLAGPPDGSARPPVVPPETPAPAAGAAGTPSDSSDSPDGADDGTAPEPSADAAASGSAAAPAGGTGAGPSPSPSQPAAAASPPAVATVPTSPVGAAESAPASTLVAPPSGPIAEVIALTNTERAKVGCADLVADDRLAAAAQAHSADMATNNYFSHTSRDGKSPFQRIASAGYTFSVAAENIAAGQRTSADVVAGWMNSPGHRANILNCSLTQIGVGFATGGSYGTYWTQDFGTP